MVNYIFTKVIIVITSLKKRYRLNTPEKYISGVYKVYSTKAEIKKYSGEFQYIVISFVE